MFGFILGFASNFLRDAVAALVGAACAFAVNYVTSFFS